MTFVDIFAMNMLYFAVRYVWIYCHFNSITRRSQLTYIRPVDFPHYSSNTIMIGRQVRGG